MTLLARYKIPVAIFGVLILLHTILTFTSSLYSIHTSHLNPLTYLTSSSTTTYDPLTNTYLQGQSLTPWPEGHLAVPVSSIPRMRLSNGTEVVGFVSDAGLKPMGRGKGSGGTTSEDNGGVLSGERRKANAVFVVLARNSDLWSFVESMKQMEDRFNWWAGYDYVFLNEEPFDENFKKYTQATTNANCFYGKIDHADWYQPDWIDEEKATAAREAMIQKQVIYGHSVPYRNMCRFNSGFFYHHPLLANYDYYWRVEPSVKFYCDISYDPFLVMQDEKKVYGFTISLFEYIETIPTLWETTKEFINANPQYIPEGNAMKFLSDDGGDSYNKCHFWSNFEIGDLNFWRGEAYQKYFEHLDKAGGFYYERWGDAPVHSIGAALFAKKEQIHFFEDIGYHHPPFTHCPQGDAHSRGKCWCPPENNFDWEWYSCTNKYVDMFKE